MLRLLNYAIEKQVGKVVILLLLLYMRLKVVFSRCEDVEKIELEQTI